MKKLVKFSVSKTVSTGLTVLPLILLFTFTSLESTTPFASMRDVPIIENKEPLIDLREQTTISFDPEFLQDNPDSTMIRQAVYTKLCEAQKLLPCGVRFQMNAGLRSLKVQAKMFEEMHQAIQKKFPKMNEKELFLETSKFIAPVKSWEGNANVPPHSTGGAIDIVLIREDGSDIDMGVNLDDPYNADFIRTDSTRISSEARKNRDIMAKALLAVGFVNYPAEFWHWSYGDRRWAFTTGAHHSFYGSIAEK